MCELEDQAMRDAEAAARRAVDAMNHVDRFFGPSLQRARDLADKISRAAKLCREVDNDGNELPDHGVAIDAEEYRREER